MPKIILEPQACPLNAENRRKILTLPEELAVLVQNQVDYKARPITKPKLEKMMKYFGVRVSAHLPKNYLKDDVIRLYRVTIQPMIIEFLQSDIVMNDPPPNGSNPAPSTSSAKGPNPTPLNSDPDQPSPGTSNSHPDGPAPAPSTSQPNRANAPLPTSRNGRRSSSSTASTATTAGKTRAADLRATLKKQLSSLVTPGFSKTALLKLQSHSLGKKSTATTSHQFVTRPHILPLEELRLKNRDIIRHTLQCYCPQVYIPLASAQSKPILLAIYNKLILNGEDTSTEGLCEGVHYVKMSIQELVTDGTFND